MLNMVKKKHSHPHSGLNQQGLNLVHKPEKLINDWTTETSDFNDVWTVSNILHIVPHKVSTCYLMSSLE